MSHVMACGIELSWVAFGWCILCAYRSFRFHDGLVRMCGQLAVTHSYTMKELEQASWYRHFFRILLFRKYRDLYGPILQLTLDGHNPVIPGVERWWILYKHIYLAIPYKDRKAIRLRMASGLGLEATIDQYLRIDVDKFIDSWKIRDASDMWGSALRMTAGADEYDEIMAMQDSL